MAEPLYQCTSLYFGLLLKRETRFYLILVYLCYSILNYIVIIILSTVMKYRGLCAVLCVAPEVTEFASSPGLFRGN